jgi:hypothetical protein
VAAHPAFAAADITENAQADKQLFATHPVTLTVGFRAGEPQATPLTEVFTVPAGFTTMSGHAADESAADGLPPGSYEEMDYRVVIGEQPGPFPASVTWTQSDGTRQGNCTASVSGTFTLQPAGPPTLSRPKVTRGLPDESRVELTIPRRGADLRPLEVRYRAAGKQRFPGPNVPLRTVVFPQREGDPGYNKLRTITVRTKSLRVRMEPQPATPGGVTFTFDAGTSPKGSPYGYDLDVYQGGQRAARLRVAGRCSRNGGSVSCAFKRIKLG